jgi:hypothetical protein
MSGCAVAAFEGAHGTGKSTLAHALVAYYKARSVNAALVSETARRSAFIEAVVIHGSGSFGIEAELQLFAAQIAEEQLAARHHELIVCDKTLANVVGYARLLTSEVQDSADLLDAMAGLVAAYASYYDTVFYMSEMYDPSKTKDPYRPLDQKFQVDADRYIRRACEDTGIILTDFPRGLDMQAQVEWASQEIDRTLL